MGGAVRSGLMVGALAQPEPGGAHSVIVRREALKPGERPVFAGFENRPVKRISSPPHISEERAVANDFQQEAEHIKTGYLCNSLQI